MDKDQFENFNMNKGLVILILNLACLIACIALVLNWLFTKEVIIEYTIVLFLFIITIQMIIKFLTIK